MPLPDCMMPDGAEPCKGYQELRDALVNARVSLVAFGGDSSGVMTEAEAHKLGVDMIQWTLLRQIDHALANS